MKIFFGAAIQGAHNREERARVHRLIIDAIKSCDFEVISEHTTGRDYDATAQLLEKSLGTLSELEGNEISGSIEYKPEDGWDTGTYIFEAELKEPSGIVYSIQFEKFTLIEESITKAVSWGSLGIIIGGTLVVLCAVLAIVIYRRREMLRGYVE